MNTVSLSARGQKKQCWNREPADTRKLHRLRGKKHKTKLAQRDKWTVLRTRGFVGFVFGRYGLGSQRVLGIKTSKGLKGFWCLRTPKAMWRSLRIMAPRIARSWSFRLSRMAIHGLRGLHQRRATAAGR